MQEDGFGDWGGERIYSGFCSVEGMRKGLIQFPSETGSLALLVLGPEGLLVLDSDGDHWVPCGCLINSC